MAKLLSLLAASVLTLLPALVHAQQGTGTSTAMRAPAPALTRATAETYADGAFQTAMADHRIAGAAITVVYDDKVLLSKGYGFANAETREPVDPERHLFRIASITKTFTATAIMQLVQEGKVDLEADIRTYLGDLPFDDRLGPVNVANLLTHTPGFEDRIFRYYGANLDLKDKPLDDQIAAIAPKQVRLPGQVTAYSNFGFILLGQIIERVSGLSFPDYVETRIFAPLDMDTSSARLQIHADGPDDEVLAALRAQESKSHSWSGGWHTPQTFPQNLPFTVPEGRLSVSPLDMTRYMRMHLNGGTLGDAVILSPETAERMRTPLFANAPEVASNAHGFWRTSVAGHTVLSHNGSINGFLSSMTLVPDIGLGIFVTSNSGGGRRLLTLPRRVIEYFFPGADQLAAPETPENFAERAERFTGAYLATRRNETELGKLATLAYGPIHVSTYKDDYLVVTTRGGSERYVELAPDVFASIKDGRRIRFAGNRGGEAQFLMPSGGSMAYERPELGERQRDFIVPAALGTVVSLALLAAILFGWRRPSGTPEGRQSTAIQILAEWIVRSNALVWLAFLAVLGLTMILNFADPQVIYRPFPPPSVRIFSALAVAGTVLAALGVLSLWVVWRGPDRSWFWRVRRTAVILVFALFALTLYDWNVLRLYA